ncbi:MAG: hypothetical protein J6A15_07625 [Clostridia bacterium]|nr:hypothetical protein [Clostridia bacterium]MBQ8379434.1 hypothetical protein [Clostridia bacterium]
MENLWVIYWLFLAFALVFGVIHTIKIKKCTGIMQIVLSIILPIWALVFSLKRNWIDGNESEIEFLLSKIIEGSIEAIIIVILFIVLFGVTIYNLLNYIRNK